MGGGAPHVNLPTIQSRTSSPILPASLSPSSSSTVIFPVSVNNNASSLNRAQFSSIASSSSSCHCSCETGCVHGKDHKRASGSVYYDAFSHVPSEIEVETAIAALNNFMKDIFSSVHGYERVKDAFRLLQRDPTIKRLVVSLSSDKAVWNAIMRNETLQQLQGLYTNPAENCRIESCDQEMDVVTCILNWIMDITKSKVSELMRKFELLMNGIFQVPETEKRPAEESREEVDDRIASSLLLSVVILIIVVVARVQRP